MPVRREYSGTGTTLDEALNNAVQAARADQGPTVTWHQKEVLGVAGGIANRNDITVIITAPYVRRVATTNTPRP